MTDTALSEPGTKRLVSLVDFVSKSAGEPVSKTCRGFLCGCSGSVVGLLVGWRYTCSGERQVPQDRVNCDGEVPTAFAGVSSMEDESKAAARAGRDRDPDGLR